MRSVQFPIVLDRPRNIEPYSHSMINSRGSRGLEAAIYRLKYRQVWGKRFPGYFSSFDCSATRLRGRSPSPQRVPPRRQVSPPRPTGAHRAPLPRRQQCSGCSLVSSPVQWRLSLAHPPLIAELATPGLGVPSPQLATSARRLARSVAARASGFSCRRSASSSTVAATSRGRTGRPFASTNGPSVSVSSRSEGSPATS